MARALAFAALALSTACASDPMPQIRRDFAAGRYDAARDALAAAEAAAGGDRHVYALERAVTELAVGDPDAAEAALRAARDRLDALQGGGALEWLGAVLLDERQTDYAGADYETVLVRALLAVANLMRGGRDAGAYALQVLEVQRALMAAFEAGGEHPKQAYKLVAFGSYLRAILAEGDPLRRDAARHAYQATLDLEPQLQLAHDGLARSTDGQHSARGNGVVHVLALVGRGPYRVEVDAPATRDVLAIAQLVWAQIRGRVTFPNISRVLVPALAFHADNPTEVHVEADGRWAGVAEVVTDVEQTAQREFEAMGRFITARAVLRRVVKIAVTEGLKEAINPKEQRQRSRPRSGGDPRPRRNPPPRAQANPLIDLAVSLGGLLWTAVERADLRCWSLLPARFAALRLELPVGLHRITIVAGAGGTPVGAPQHVDVLVRDGFNSYVLALVPTLRGGPPPLTSDPFILHPDTRP